MSVSKNLYKTWAAMRGAGALSRKRSITVPHSDLSSTHRGTEIILVLLYTQAITVTSLSY